VQAHKYPQTASGIAQELGLAFIKLESLAFMASKIHRMWLPQEVV
jgi:hypothetical protein